eukprot:TRINITY_DN3447_c1_g2_i3.p1 TRINITY_DN3447_c1_g2~~TRINITY_DN3447_c1_g2_i3.p1  ORF type:complete len:183 (-),score=17.60 TRINITY_DN3447_c1_g2_i3:303-851(-)
MVQGAGCSDRCTNQRFVNVVTSLPLIYLGWRIQRKYEGTDLHALGQSISVVGYSASIYHASKGSLRPWMRKLDYWSIAFASNKLLSMVKHSYTPILMPFVPFRPTLVTTINLAQIQMEFSKRVQQNPKLSRIHKLHVGLGGLGGLCFLTENKVQNLGFLHTHAMWHLLATGALAAAVPLIKQ